MVLQGELDQIKSNDRALYDKIVTQMNDNLNDPSFLVGIYGTDAVIMEIIAGVRENLVHDLDFGNYDDRMAIGRALLKHVKDGGTVDALGINIPWLQDE